MTPSSTFPWPTARLGSLVTHQRGVTYSSRDLAQDDGFSVPFVNLQSFRKHGGYNPDGLKFFDGPIREEDLLSPRDLLLANTDLTPTGDVIGAPILVPPELHARDVVASHHVSILKLSEQLDTSFAYYVLCWGKYRRAMRSISAGTTVLNLDKKALLDIEIPLPSLPEQKKIADILGSVDDAIQATQAVIDQTRQVKQGLLQELLTRGIEHTRFKQTEIGEIPESWHLLPIEQLLVSRKNAMRSGPFGSALRKDELVAEGVPFLGIDNVHQDRFVANFKRFVSEEKFQELSRYQVFEDDVMITIMGTVGRCCIFPGGVGRALSSKHVWTMTFDQSRYLPKLVSLQLNFAPWVQRHFARTSQGGIMSAISSDIIRSTLLPCPPIDEQVKILSMLNSTGATIEAEEEKLRSLATIKRSLMAELLTGRKRVEVSA